MSKEHKQKQIKKLQVMLIIITLLLSFGTINSKHINMIYLLNISTSNIYYIYFLITHRSNTTSCRNFFIRYFNNNNNSCL